MCFADLNGDKAAEVAAANEKRAADNGAKVMAATVDVTEREQVRAMIAKAVEAFGKLDVKFNNAGVNKPMNAGSRSTAEGTTIAAQGSSRATQRSLNRSSTAFMRRCLAREDAPSGRIATSASYASCCRL